MNGKDVRKAFDNAACISCGKSAESTGEHALMYDDYHHDGDSIYQPVECLHCEAKWTEIYRFVGIVQDPPAMPVYLTKAHGRL